MDVKKEKRKIRERIWRALEESGVARFPRPVYHRIPNFEGSDRAARLLAETKEFKEARAVKVNPDTPQREVRYEVLLQGKLLITPTPRLKDGFVLLDPKRISKRSYIEASTISGSFKYGHRLELGEMPKVDLIVMGSVAVTLRGERLGKGGGYGEIEYGILRELNVIDENTPVFTTVHRLQLVDQIPFEEHDVPVDYIITPDEIIKVQPQRSKPSGILWDRITHEQLEQMPILKLLKNSQVSTVPFNDDHI